MRLMPPRIIFSQFLLRVLCYFIIDERIVVFSTCLRCRLIYDEGQKLKGNELYTVSKNSLDGEYESRTHFFLNGLIIIILK